MQKLFAIVGILFLVAACSDEGPSKPKASNTNNVSNNTTNNVNNTGNNGGNNVNNELTEFGYPIAVGGGGSSLDLLMVIDNTASMCRYQQLLRENSGQLFRALAERTLDFQIGVTTTHMNADYPLEPVAQPGQLQSTPQPVPGFDRTCQNGLTSSGEIIEGDFTPIREMIDLAVDCMETPDPSSYIFTDSEIECATAGIPNCEIPSAGCGGDRACGLEDLFPPATSYRPLPKVLRSLDYTDAGGQLDVSRMVEDFRCMSMVGTRGFGVEEGLKAAVAAVSPELTGGSVENPTDASAPNHGLLRERADFGLMFVSDENDCSNESLDVTTSCGGNVCYYSDSELLDIGDMQSQLLGNLSQSKGGEVGPADVYVASLHGNAVEPSIPTPSDAECREGEGEIQPVCTTQLGSAFTGQRYEAFLRQFPATNIYPKPSPEDPDASLTGWMCTGDFAPALPAIADVIGSGSCFQAAIAECTGDCPADPFSGAPGECVERTDETGSYCTSQIQIRAVAPPSVIEGISYCIPETVQQTMGGESVCTIDKSNYQILPCAAGGGAFEISWIDSIEAINVLAGVRVFVYEASE